MPLDATISSAPTSDCHPSPALMRNPATIDGTDAGEQYFGDHSPMTRTECLRRLDQTRLDILGATVGIDDAWRKGAAEDDQHRSADAGAEPQRRERHPC